MKVPMIQANDDEKFSTQQEVADRYGMTQAQVSRILNGKSGSKLKLQWVLVDKEEK